MKILLVLFVLISTFSWGYFNSEITEFFVIEPPTQKANVISAQSAEIDPQKYYQVTNVVDGDTFKVNIDGKEITVRMLGINTPEVVDPRKPPECYGQQASEKTKALLNNQKVKLALNPNREKTDKYNRLLAYVYLNDGLFINELLIKEGFAKEYTFGKAYRYQKEFKDVENEAKQNNLGLWKYCK